jgi:hypothetical protein
MRDVLAHAELLLEQRRLKDAVRAFNLAAAEGHNMNRCGAGRWMAAMLSGDFEAAWRESDDVRRRGVPDPNRFWQGEDVIGKQVIVRCLHGFGDAVQFLRYARPLRCLASRVIVECAPAMVGLARCMPGIDEVIVWGPNAPAVVPDWDVQIEVMELPYIFRSTLASVPSVEGFLKLPVSALDAVHNALGSRSRQRVGIVWASGEWNPARSIRLETLLPIFERSDCEFWNLQGGSAREEWKILLAEAPVRDHPLLNDAGLLPLAAFIAHMDLVITVDTLAAHLAGALTVPCFLMLQHAADWRWMTERTDSPWYPSVRLFRQPRPGDWETAVFQICTALETRSAVEVRRVA